MYQTDGHPLKTASLMKILNSPLALLAGKLKSFIVVTLNTSSWDPMGEGILQGESQPIKKLSLFELLNVFFGNLSLEIIITAAICNTLQQNKKNCN